MRNGFAPALRHWRQQRGLSQMQLGLAASVSARHLSFLETGRARPSRMMVMQLAEALNTPREARNRMLTGAGFAEAYRARSPDSADMAPVRRAVRRIIKRHEPYPALVLDRLWRILDANKAGMLMASDLGLEIGDSVLDGLLNLPDPAEKIENWPEVAFHVLQRLNIESAYHGGLAELDAAAARFAADPQVVAYKPEFPLPALIPTRYRFGGQVLSLFSTFSQFGTAEDIALADIRIEMMFPADDATATVLEALAAGR
jgi:transcriptional regulator with XRE-family HTH domain